MTDPAIINKAYQDAFLHLPSGLTRGEVAELRARVAALTKERDEALAARDSWKRMSAVSEDYAKKQSARAEAAVKRLREDTEAHLTSITDALNQRDAALATNAALTKRAEAAEVDAETWRESSLSADEDVATLRTALGQWKCSECGGDGVANADSAGPCGECGGSGKHPIADAALKATE